MATDNIAISHFTFHENTSNISTGNVMIVNGGAEIMSISIEVTGTATIVFEGTNGNDENFYLLGDCVNKSTLDMNNSTTISNNRELWIMDLIALAKVRCNVVSITGSVKIIGYAVN